MTLVWTSLQTPDLETTVVWMLPGVVPTINCGLVQGVCVDLVVVIGHEHASVCVPVVPQHPGDGRGEVRQLKARMRHLRVKTHANNRVNLDECPFLMEGPVCPILKEAWYSRSQSDGFVTKQWCKTVNSRPLLLCV